MTRSSVLQNRKGGEEQARRASLFRIQSDAAFVLEVLPRIANALSKKGRTAIGRFDHGYTNGAIGSDSGRNACEQGFLTRLCAPAQQSTLKEIAIHR